MQTRAIILFLALLNYSYAQDDEFSKAIESIFTTKSSSGIFDGYEEVTTPKVTDLGAIERCGEGADKGKHMCVEYFNCDAKTKTIIPSEEYDGSGLIDIRFGNSVCDDYLKICCKIPDDGVIPPEITKPVTEGPVITPVDPPVVEKAYCGIRHPGGVDFKIVGNTDNEAEYGEFPWMMAILNKYHDASSDSPLSICGGSLIAPNVVLTGAHCVYNRKADEILVRAGEWDTQTERERYPYQERSVFNIIVHEKFNSNNLFNDVGLLILDQPFKAAPHISTICLPNQGTVFNSRNCFASGWGKTVFGVQGRYQVILKKIELPTVEKGQCQELLRNTRLSKKFKLHESFMCGGGEPGKDTCTGDGGSPLVCPDPYNPNRYVQAGIVAWGIACGEIDVPGVYADVAYFRNWIDQKLAGLNIDNTPYIE